MTITSPANQKVKLIRKLHERKYRESSGLFYIEGLRIVAEAIQLNAGLEYLMVAEGLLSSDFGRSLVQKAVGQGLPVIEVSPDTFKSFSMKEGPQGIGAVVRQSWVNLDQIQIAPGKSWVALDAVQDPGNLGTILRTSDAVGGVGVILLDHSTDPYDPGAVRGSMGAIFSQGLVKTDLDHFSHWKKQTRYPLVGTSGAAAQDYHHFSYPDPCILLMGSEREGLNERHLQLCDNIIKIPMVGRSDSLNLAVATAVVLYEIFDQRRDKL